MSTRWNGEPVEARRVVVVVADAPEFPSYWARGLVGQERDAVEVTVRADPPYAGLPPAEDVFYLDDAAFDAGPPVTVELRPGVTATFSDAAAANAGSGWLKVTNGGGPELPHREMAVERVVRER